MRVVDLYDVVQPWAKESEFAGDGLQPQGPHILSGTRDDSKIKGKFEVMFPSSA